MTKHSLNLDASFRQAIGRYARPNHLGRLTELVKAQTLRLPPQPDWTGDITDWTADPFHDRNWQFQFHTLRWINPLMWSALDGDDESRTLWRSVAESWFKANIPASQAKAPFAWKDMADGNRAIQLALGAPLIEDDDQWYFDLLQAHVDWLMDQDHIVRGNHALHQHSGLLVAGAVLRNSLAMETARKRMIDQFGTSFDHQGTNDEGSITYHQLNLVWWQQAWHRVAMENLEVPSLTIKALRKASTVLAHLAQPDGRLPMIGDGLGGKIRPGLGKHSDFIASQGKQGEPPKENAVVLERGYATSISGWGENRPLSQESHMVLRHGPRPWAHAHDDRGSLHIFARGRPWLVDSGFHSYQRNDQIVDYLESRKAHNVALLAGLDHNAKVNFEILRFNQNSDFTEFVVVDQGYKDRRLERRVIYLTAADCWLIWDQVDRVDNTRLEQRWHIDTEIRVRRHDRGFELVDVDKTMNMTWLGRLPKLRLHKAGDGDLTGWIGKTWKTLEPGALVTASAADLNPDRLVVLLSPSSGTRLAVATSYVTAEGQLRMVLTRGELQWTIHVNKDHARVSVA